jgi:hypothetical protein
MKIFKKIREFMANLIKPGDIKIVTKNNELFVNISLELNIKLDGSITNLSLSPEVLAQQAVQQKKQEEKVNWEIPDFSSGSKLNFGK